MPEPLGEELEPEPMLPEELLPLGDDDELPLLPDMPVELPLLPEDPEAPLELPLVSDDPEAPLDEPEEPLAPVEPDTPLEPLLPEEPLDPLAAPEDDPAAPELITSSLRTWTELPEPLKLARTSWPSLMSETEACCPSLVISVLESTFSFLSDPERVSLLSSNFSTVPETWFSLLPVDVAVDPGELLWPVEAEAELSVPRLVEADEPEVSLDLLLLDGSVVGELEDDDLSEPMLPDGFAVLWSLGEVAELWCVLFCLSSPVHPAFARIAAPMRAPKPAFFIRSP